MAQILGQIAEGSLVKLNENGSPVEFYAMKHNYESELNGPGRTLLVRKDGYDLIKWDDDTFRDEYATSNLDSWFNTEYLNKLDEEIAAIAAQTSFRYTPTTTNGVKSGPVETLARTIFSLSAKELGVTETYCNSEGSLLPNSTILRIAIVNGLPVCQWTRTRNTSGSWSEGAIYLKEDGSIDSTAITTSLYAARPCLTLPSTMIVDDDGNIQPTAIRLGEASSGSIIKIKENGVRKKYIVLHQGNPDPDLYDESCDGTWVLREDIAGKGKRNSTDDNQLPGSTIMQTMAGYLNLYDPGIQVNIKTVKIPYCKGGGGRQVYDGANGLECQIFPLGYFEYGITETTNIPVDSAGLKYFFKTSRFKRVAYFEGAATPQWTRTTCYTPSIPKHCYIISDTGIQNTDDSDEDFIGYRPAMILNPNLTILSDGTLVAAPVFNAIPIQIMEGQSLSISWSTMEMATSYTLQRKVDEGEWETIYTGAKTSYTDTVPTGTTLQYQVQATIDGTPGAFGQSEVISVIPASALAISGEDSNLGTITNDITYAVNTDTGNEITVTRTVNGQVVATLTVDDGFAYTIPVMDLPTGSGTIVISASVEGGSGPVTATRTWGYTKTLVKFPSGASVAQITQNGQNLFPPTLAEAVKVPINWGGSLDKALELLYPAVNSAVISVGTYEGTGTFGQDNPSKLTFDDTPLVVTIYGGGQTLVISSTDTGSTAYISGNEAIWYSAESAAAQMNTSGTTYSYVAVGKGQASA